MLKNCWDTLWKGGASAPPFRGSKFHSSVTCLGESRKSSRTPLRRGPEVWTFGNHEAAVLHQGTAFYPQMTVRPARLAEVRHRSRGTSLEPASHTATSVGIPTHVHGAHPEGSQTSQANVRSTRLPADVRVITSKGEPRHCIDSEHKYLTPVAVLSRQSWPRTVGRGTLRGITGYLSRLVDCRSLTEKLTHPLQFRHTDEDKSGLFCRVSRKIYMPTREWCHRRIARISCLFR